MTNETQEQGREKQEGLYEHLVRESQALVRRVSAHQGTENFDDLVVEHNTLLKEYIEGFDYLSTEQCERASRIINQTKQYIHGVLDVCRLREMRNVMIQSVKTKRSR